MPSTIALGAIGAWEGVSARLRAAGEFIPGLVMRVVLGWEFFEAGLVKYRGENWFAGIHDRFPFPFDRVPAELSWNLATWFELVGGVLLWLGLGTRLVAFSLLFLTFVATAAVHWPDMVGMWSELLKGYSISDMGHGNFKLPLLFVVMLLPLIFDGAGRVSLDHLLARASGLDTSAAPVADACAAALAAAVLAPPVLMLAPIAGAALALLALAAAVFARHARA